MTSRSGRTLGPTLSVMGLEAFGGLRHISAERRHIVAQYRQRKKIWILERFPSMSDDQWKEFMKWVVAFGASE